MESNRKFGKYEEVKLTELKEYWLWGRWGGERKDASHVPSCAKAC